MVIVFSLTLPLIQGQRGIIMAVIVRHRLRKVVWVPQAVEIRVLQSKFSCGPLVSVQNQHLLQQVDTCRQSEGQNDSAIWENDTTNKLCMSVDE